MVTRSELGPGRRRTQLTPGITDSLLDRLFAGYYFDTECVAGHHSVERHDASMMSAVDIDSR